MRNPTSACSVVHKVEQRVKSRHRETLPTLSGRELGIAMCEASRSNLIHHRANSIGALSYRVTNCLVIARACSLITLP